MNNSTPSTISLQINHFLCASSVLSLAILACSLVFLGGTSFWLSEAGILLTIIHHAAVVHDRRKLNKLRAQDPTSLPLPLSARKPMIFLAIFASAVYTAAFAIVMIFVIYRFNGLFETEWEDSWAATIIELVCLLFEAPITLMIALWGMRERRAMLGAAETGKWYHLPQYNRTQ